MCALREGKNAVGLVFVFLRAYASFLSTCRTDHVLVFFVASSMQGARRAARATAAALGEASNIVTKKEETKEQNAAFDRNPENSTPCFAALCVCLCRLRKSGLTTWTFACCRFPRSLCQDHITRAHAQTDTDAEQGEKKLSTTRRSPRVSNPWSHPRNTPFASQHRTEQTAETARHTGEPTAHRCVTPKLHAGV